jgi:hypothetical protein
MTEYKRFEKMVTTLLKVPHSEIKEKLEAEKAGGRPGHKPVGSNRVPHPRG